MDCVTWCAIPATKMEIKMRTCLCQVSFWLMAVLSMGVMGAGFSDPVAHLLALDSAPAGVVFEIVSGDSDALDEALPQAHDATRRLRKRFPGLDVVIVSHGREQFALLKSESERAPQVHSKVRSLLADDVTVHVCGTHASWRGKVVEDFPDYVDVAASGPAQINDYEALGFEVVVLDP